MTSVSQDARSISGSMTRRSFMDAIFCVMGACLVPRAIAANAPTADGDQAAAQPQSGNAPTKDSGLKFFSDGRPRPFAGNTVICHLPAQSMCGDAIAALRKDLQSAVFRRKIALLPQDSYHMTVFSGANDQNRPASAWPSDIPYTASLDECNAALLKRFRTASIHGHFPIRVKLNVAETKAHPHVCSLRMEAADEREEDNLRSLRDQLAAIYQYRAPDHEQYKFHITVAYTLTDFTPAEGLLYQELLQEHLPTIIRSAPVLELGLPEYCVFKDMYRYEVEAFARIDG